MIALYMYDETDVNLSSGIAFSLFITSKRNAEKNIIQKEFTSLSLLSMANESHKETCYCLYSYSCPSLDRNFTSLLQDHSFCCLNTNRPLKRMRYSYEVLLNVMNERGIACEFFRFHCHSSCLLHNFSSSLTCSIKILWAVA